ncbi:hypothetical protein FLJU110815_06100 [Flavobacterium jumunjinense]
MKKNNTNKLKIFNSMKRALLVVLMIFGLNILLTSCTTDSYDSSTESITIQEDKIQFYKNEVTEDDDDLDYDSTDPIVKPKRD